MPMVVIDHRAFCSSGLYRRLRNLAYHAAFSFADFTAGGNCPASKIAIFHAISFRF